MLNLSDYTVIMKTLSKRRYNKSTHQTAQENIQQPDVDPIQSPSPSEHQEASKVTEDITSVKDVLEYKEESEEPALPEMISDEDPYLLISEAEKELDDAEDEKEEKVKKQKKRLELFEHVDMDQIETMKDIDEAINYDGYYDEMYAKDRGEEFRRERKKVNLLALSGILVAMLICIGMIAYGLGGFE